MEVLYSERLAQGRREWPCMPIEIQPRQMHWYGADWYLPAVYGCAQGMVLDLFAAVPEAEFEAFCDRRIDNNGTLEETRRQINGLLTE